MKFLLVCFGLVPILFVASCATDDPNRRAKQGAAVGAITGAVIGHQIDHDRGAIIGAAIGGLTGATVGRYQDAQQRELEAALAAEQRAKQIEILRVQEETLKVSLSNDASFGFDQAVLQPPFYPALDKLSTLLVKYDQTRLRVVGHTDSIGSENYNQALSIRRAQAVAEYLIVKGVPALRIDIEGRGESEPRVLNDTAANRRLNRRVEITIDAIVVNS